jgi:putative isomerase
MRGFAERLGYRADVAYFESRKRQIQEGLMSVCFVPSERRFWDYNHATRTHTKVPTFYMFWPMFAGMELPRDVIRELLEEELLNPDRFFGAIPFPSVACNHPKFDPRGYWRGKAWPHISYWLLETLVRHGRVEEARDAGRRILAWMSARDGFPENMETDPCLIESTGHLDYNWGSAAFLLIASERFLDFTP